MEDEERFCRQTVDYLQRYAAEENLNLDIATFANGLDFLDKFSYGSFDLIFMDIRMPNSNGMSIARDIRKLDSGVGIIFLTNLTQYAIKGYEVEALDYIVKPVEYAVFKAKLKKAMERLRKREDTYIALNTKSELRGVSLNQIVYVESMGHRAVYHLLEEDVTTWESMTAVEEKLSQYHFSRCSSSYCVNLKYVESVQGMYVKVGGNELKISRGKYKSFMDALTVFFSGGEGR